MILCLLILPAPHCVSAGISCLSVCVHVSCHMPVLCCCMYWADCLHVGVPRILCVLRKLGTYISKDKVHVIPSWTWSQALDFDNLATAHLPSPSTTSNNYRSVIDNTWRWRQIWPSAISPTVNQLPSPVADCCSHVPYSIVYRVINDWQVIAQVCQHQLITCFIHSWYCIARNSTAVMFFYRQ